MTDLAKLLPWTDKALSGTTITVRTQAEFKSAIDALDAGSGGTVLLDGTGGPYSIWERGIGGEDKPIVIAALDPETPPKVTNIWMKNVSHVAMVGLEVDGGPADGSGDYTLYDSDNVAMVDSTMTGDAEGFRDSWSNKADSAMIIRNSDDITFAGNVIKDYNHAFAFLEVDGITLQGNEVTGIQGDGFRGGGLQNVLITENWFHDFYGSAQQINHTDMIQFWGTNARSLNRDITISNNILDSGDGAASQSIFMRNEEFGRGDGEVNGYFQNITITGNVVRNGATNAIAVGDAEGVVIADNTLIWNSAARTKSSIDGDWGGSVVPAIRMTNTPGVVVENNIAPSYMMRDATYELTRDPADLDKPGMNFVTSYSNEAGENFIEDHFVNALPGGSVDFRDFMLRADSPLLGKVGSPLSWSPSGDVEGVLAVMAADCIPGNQMAIELCAHYSFVDGERVDEDSATAVWTFDDGTVLEGWNVGYQFDSPGQHEVTLQVTTADGEVDTITRTVEVADPVLFDFDFSDGVTDASSQGTHAWVGGTAEGAFVEGRDGLAFHLTDDRSIGFSRGNGHLYNLDAFEISMGFQQSSATGTGGLVYLHNALSAQIEGDGSLRFRLETTEGNFVARTEAGVMRDTDWHDITFRFDGINGEMSIVVDGVEEASIEASGTTKPPASWGFVLGKAWGNNAEGLVDDLKMSVPTVTEVDFDTDRALQVEAGPAEPPRETLVALDFEDGLIDTSDYASTINVKDPDGIALTEGKDGGTGFHLTGDTKFAISRSAGQLTGMDDFDLSFSFKQDDADDTGILMSQHTITTVKVLDGGALRFFLRTDAGEKYIQTEKGVLDDTDWHDITLSFDGADEEMAIVVDGETLATGELGGATREKTYWGFTVGNPWGDSIAGTIDDFAITAEDTSADASLFDLA